MKKSNLPNERKMELTSRDIRLYLELKKRVEGVDLEGGKPSVFNTDYGNKRGKTLGKLLQELFDLVESRLKEIGIPPHLLVPVLGEIASCRREIPADFNRTEEILVWAKKRLTATKA